MCKNNRGRGGGRGWKEEVGKSEKTVKRRSLAEGGRRLSYFTVLLVT
jgi:hypothetical protein